MDLLGAPEKDNSRTSLKTLTKGDPMLGTGNGPLICH